VADILFVCVDGLSGFVEAIEATFPAATVQTCLVHYADLPVMPTRSAESFRPYGGRASQLSKWSALPAQAAG
jgi:hypothetical protein